ncbi:unnamed protein product [Polarella glacialis]|uniref:Uncharacterized protein n=2 Tax=Polarella glacialis TaxID=89957 RepID=A0A813IEW5_POLGL|nr:unnamed protein product [Polarella glacialis]|mmetsp:Transcript_63861/g.103395  ORF Transcript_63861/g.103395 Transcript_63861/m.103395 type:complete len:111 (+) Transcript_63861:95-427(+)
MAAPHRPKLAPDFIIQKTIQKDNQYAAAADYKKQMDLIGGVTAWFEGKQKYDFNEVEKRNQSFIQQEMHSCMEELKIRRRTRLRQLYDQEARGWESELAQVGLAVQRQNL